MLHGFQKPRIKSHSGKELAKQNEEKNKELASIN